MPSAWSSTHCRAALENTASNWPSLPAAHSEISPAIQHWRGYSCRARSIISAELSSPVNSASGQRSRSTAVQFPGPHPRSITRRTSATAIREARSRQGCVRSSANFRYWFGFQPDIFRLKRKCRTGQEAYPTTLERQVQRRLQEARTADRMLNLAQAAIRRNLGWPRVIGEEHDIVVGRVKIGVIEEIERVEVEAQTVALAKLELFAQGHIEAHLERRAEEVAARIAVKRFPHVASG